jgi:DNA-binding ferritin-like protein
MSSLDVKALETAPLATPTDLEPDAVRDIAGALNLCDKHGDIASASLLENWIDEAERRSWFLFESTRKE